MMMTLAGPADLPQMEVTVTVDPISLTLSPAVVRLIIHAVQTLVPKKVRGHVVSVCTRLTVIALIGGQDRGGTERSLDETGHRKQILVLEFRYGRICRDRVLK